MALKNMDEVLQKYVKFMLETDINARCGMDRSNQQKITIGKIIIMHCISQAYLNYTTKPVHILGSLSYKSTDYK
jgi:hypothetical protein